MTDSEILNEIREWVEELKEYDVLTNPILKGLLIILKEEE